MMCKKAIVLFFIVLLSTLLVSCSGINPVSPSDDEVLDYDEVDTYSNTTNKDGLVIFNLEDVQIEVKVEDGKSGMPLIDINVDIFLYEDKIAYFIVDPSGDYIPKIIAEEQGYKNVLPPSRLPVISNIEKLFQRTEWALEGYTSGGAQFSDQIDSKFFKYLFNYIFQYGGKATLGDLKYSMEDTLFITIDSAIGAILGPVLTVSSTFLLAIDVIDLGDTFATAEWAKKYESLGYSDNDQFEVYYWIPVFIGSTVKVPYYPVIIPMGEPGEFMDEECIPDLLSPSNGAVLDNGCYDKTDLITWTFDWSDCPGVTYYHLYVMGPHPATIPLVDNNYITSSSYTFNGYGYIADKNRFNWTWKVRAMVNGQWGPWTEEGTFNVEPLNTDCDF